VVAAVVEAYESGMTVAQVAEAQNLGLATVYHILKDEGVVLRSRRSPSVSAAMYFDYCTGMSTAEVAEKWGVTRSVVCRRLAALGVPKRRHKGMPSRNPSVGSVDFGDANAARTLEAASRRVPQAERALAVTVDDLHRRVLGLRIAYPDKSLAELAGLFDPPMTKDMYAGHLRRAIENAKESA